MPEDSGRIRVSWLVWNVYLSSVSPARIHNSRDAVWPRRSSPRSSKGMITKGGCLTVANPAADARGSRTPDLLAEFRGHNKTTVSPAGCSAILCTRSLLSSGSKFVPLSRGPSKNQCDLTCALPLPRSRVPTETYFPGSWNLDGSSISQVTTDEDGVRHTKLCVLKDEYNWHVEWIDEGFHRYARVSMVYHPVRKCRA